MQPIDPLKSPKVNVPTLNHIGLWVDNLESAVKELTDKDVKFTPGGIRKGAGTKNCLKQFVINFGLTCIVLHHCKAGYNVTFIHPKSAAGVLVELVQAPDDVIQALSKL